MKTVDSEFVEENSHLTDVEEDVVLAGIGNVRGEVLANDAVPVGRVLLVKEALDVF